MEDDVRVFISELFEITGFTITREQIDNLVWTLASSDEARTAFRRLARTARQLYIAASREEHRYG